MEYNFYGRQVGVCKIPKNQVYRYIADEVTRVTRVPVTKINKIQEVPNALRHSCPRTGIVFLQKFEYSVPTPSGVILVPYYFCSMCGTLFIYSEFYD